MNLFSKSNVDANLMQNLKQLSADIAQQMINVLNSKALGDNLHFLDEDKPMHTDGPSPSA